MSAAPGTTDRRTAGTGAGAAGGGAPAELEALVGRVLPAPGVFELREEAVRAFAEAIGGNAVPADCASPPAPVPVPPTYAAVLALEAAFSALALPRLAELWSRVVHSGQRFEYERPLRVGDRLTASVTLASVRRAAGNLLVDVVVELCDPAATLVCTSRTGLLVVAPDGGGA